MGIEGSKQASELAQAKGLDVRQGLIFGQEEKLPNSDVILAITVIEHIENIPSFLSVLTYSLLLTLNPKYHSLVVKKLEPYGVRVFSWSCRKEETKDDKSSNIWHSKVS